MEVFSLILTLPDEAEFQLEVSPDDSLLKVLQELFFFEILAENDSAGNLIIYRFVHPETQKELSLMTDFSGLIPEEGKAFRLGIEQETVEEKEEEIDMLSIVIQILDSKQEMEVEIPGYFTAGQLVEELLSMDGLIPQDGSEHTPSYHLIRLSNQEAMLPEQSFMETGILAGETLGFGAKTPPKAADDKDVPSLEDQSIPALSPSPIPSPPVSSPPIAPISAPTPTLEEEISVFDSDTNILLRFPDQLSVKQTTTCIVRIDMHHFTEYLRRKGFLDKRGTQTKDIRKLINISVNENAASPLLEIEQAVDIQSRIDSETHAEWQIVLRPLQTGFTSLILQVVMTEMDGKEGSKDIFYLNHAFEVIPTGQEPSTSLWQEYESFSTLFWWSNWLKDQIIRAVSSDSTGKAIALLCNFLQYQDQKLYQSLLLLQSQWHEGKNKSLQGGIGQKTWNDTQKKIHFAVMELVADIENQNRLKPKRIRRHIRSINKATTVAEKVS